MAPTTIAIPSFYRILFTIIDPVLCTGGIITCALLPRTYLTSYISNPIISPETKISLDVNAGFFAATLVLQLFLLRSRPNDVGIWKTVQAATVLTDFAALGAFVRVAGVQGRSAPGNWTLMEWSNNVVLGVLAIIRTAFVLGIGVRETKSKRG